MGSIISFVRHLWAIFHPPEAVKVASAVRIGLLGASWIAPMAVIIPAKSHPEVIVAAIAARDTAKAVAYAKKHNIPIVHDSYQALLDDPSLDAVYIPLPNGLHFEWALRALRAGKHVLLEKPFTSNASEARSLVAFHASMPAASRPILLEAFHYRFHPAWQLLLSSISPADIAHVESRMTLFRGFFPTDDIRFDFALAGGACMDLGTYTISSLRQVFGAEPQACLSAEARPLGNDPREKCDEAMTASWRFPNGGTGRIEVDLRKTIAFGLVPWMGLPNIAVTHRPLRIGTDDATGHVHECVKTVTLTTFAGPHFSHHVEVVEKHTLRAGPGGKAVKTWKTASKKTAYTWADRSEERTAATLPGEAYWTTYRYMLEEFINRIKGRKGSGVWVDGEDSVKQMAVIDQAYEKAGMQIRPTSSYE